MNDPLQIAMVAADHGGGVLASELGGHHASHRVRGMTERMHFVSEQMEDSKLSAEMGMRLAP